MRLQIQGVLLIAFSDQKCERRQKNSGGGGMHDLLENSGGPFIIT